MQTISALFDDYADAQKAVRDLEAAGIASSDVSIVSNRASDRTDTGEAAGTGASVGAIVGGGAGLLAGLGILAIPGLGPVVAAGWLASTALGAAVGAAAGGIVGALTEAGVSREDAEVYAEGVRRGGTLVSARVSEGQVPAGQAILNNRRSVDIPNRGAAYRRSGWTRFDDTAAPYTSEQIERERGSYQPRV